MGGRDSDPRFPWPRRTKKLAELKSVKFPGKAESNLSRLTTTQRMTGSNTNSKISTPSSSRLRNFGSMGSPGTQKTQTTTRFPGGTDVPPSAEGEWRESASAYKSFRWDLVTLCKAAAIYGDRSHQVEGKDEPPKTYETIRRPVCTTGISHYTRSITDTHGGPSTKRTNSRVDTVTRREEQPATNALPGTKKIGSKGATASKPACVDSATSGELHVLYEDHRSVQPDGKGVPISTRQNRVGWALRDGTPSEIPSTRTHGEELHVQSDRAFGLRHKGIAPQIVSSRGGEGRPCDVCHG